MLNSADLTIGALIRAYPLRISLTWALTLGETILTALIPLFIGFAIDGLLAGSMAEFWYLSVLFGVLVGLAVLRRIYDTRVYGTTRVSLGCAQAERGQDDPISALNARIGMGRELVEFLEETLPMVVTGLTQLVISVVILYVFSPLLALSAGLAALGSMAIYTLFHRRFYRLNAALNQQAEKQVQVLQARVPRPALSHFLCLRRAEVQISDSEAALYGLVFVLLLAAILFNIWHSTTGLAVTTGMIFAVVSYSWDFVDGAITLPATLQHWTRLSEIMRRINSPTKA